MRARFFLTLLLMLAPAAGISPALAGGCDKCEDLAQLYNEYANQMALLKHFRGIRDAGYPASTGSPTDVVEGGTEAYHTDLNTSDCKIYKPVNGKYVEVTAEDIENDKDYCPIIAKNYANHERLHQTNCRKLWRPHGTPIEPRMDDRERRQYTTDDEIKAYEQSTAELKKYIEELALRCIEERSKCLRRCEIDFGFDVHMDTSFKDKLVNSCKKRCPVNGGAPIILKKSMS